MMENEGWPVKYQQSGAGNCDSTEVSLNNGENNDKSAATTSDENADLPLDPNQITQNERPTISEKASQLIPVILEQLNEFSNTEKYFLYLKLFQVSNVVDPLRQPLNPLGSRSEINRTISWIKTHLEEDPETSLPKQQVYEEYSDYCLTNQIKSLSQADFGKVMKQVYPKVRARRLGTRGNSRYCYSGLRRCIKLNPPQLPDLADKPLSTEEPCTLSNLTAASWLIVKEWSEIHFGIQFSSLQALARFLVVNHSIGVGTAAASQLTSAAESQIRGDLNVITNKNVGNKHREMQLQLQKKIQQKSEGKERKRKTQSPKCETRTKKSRSASVTAVAATTTTSRLDTSPTLSNGGVGESSTSTSTGSTSTSPTQGKPICDKSLDFTQLPALPDFKSFQKPVCEQQQSQQQQQQQQNSLGTSGGATLKVAIPRLTGLKAQQHLQRSPQSSPKKQQQQQQVKNNAAKYKAIQPKPQPCDNASYNPQLNADIRSQGVLHNVDRFKERKSSDEDDCDAPVFPLPRERLDSISNVDKDAMDEYLGTNNSQHEEELSKYFSNTTSGGGGAATTTTDQDNTTKLSQLRQLLEQHGVVTDSRNFPTAENSSITLANSQSLIDPLSMTPLSAIPFAAGSAPSVLTVTGNVHIIPTNCNSNSSARRRVSFEPPNLQDETSSSGAVVPPSPNTRRKNFSFTPISPGPQSPSNLNTTNNNNSSGGRQSKCSSTNVSPFVSPRNTPIPRTKNNTHQNAGLGISRTNNNNNNNNNLINKTIKREQNNDLSLELVDVKCFQNVNMSAPASPMLQPDNKSVLEKLLHSSGKITYSDYIKSDINDLLQNQSGVDTFMYRSQSVPLNQMIKSNFVDDAQLFQNPNGGDFNDYDSITETESESVDRIINSLDEQQFSTTSTTNATPTNLPRFDLISNNLNIGAFSVNNAFPRATLGRSQSIDVNGCYDINKGATPSRSVPNTPLSFKQQQRQMSTTGNSSRSYPSTPVLVNEPTFNYTVNSDCLLNGQPIRSSRDNNGATAAPTDNLYMYDNNIERNIEDFGIDARVALQTNDFDGNGLMDENGVLMVDQNFDTN